jgi:hypothetical protein
MDMPRRVRRNPAECLARARPPGVRALFNVESAMKYAAANGKVSVDYFAVS